MAFPFTRYITFSALSQVGSAFLNDVQDKIIGLYTGTLSLKAMVVDGVGANAAAPSPGQIIHQKSAVADAPLYLWRDASGNNRHVIDHNGYPMGRRSEVREEFDINGTITASGDVTNYRKLKVNNSATSSFQFGVGLLSGYPHNTVLITAGTSGTTISLIRYGGFLDTSTGTTAVIEWEMAMPTTGATNASYRVGLYDASFANGIYFSKTGAQTTWQATVEAASVATSANTTVAPATSMQRFRIEYQGSASPYGAKTARFFINETLTNTVTVGLPSSGNPLQFSTLLFTSGVSEVCYLAPMLFSWNRYLSLPAL